MAMGWELADNAASAAALLARGETESNHEKRIEAISRAQVYATLELVKEIRELKQLLSRVPQR